MNETKFTQGPWELRDVSGAGLQIRATLGPSEARREWAGVGRIRGDVPVTIYHMNEQPSDIITFDTWTQFPNKKWDEMQIANGHLIAASRDYTMHLVI